MFHPWCTLLIKRCFPSHPAAASRCHEAIGQDFAGEKAFGEKKKKKKKPPNTSSPKLRSVSR